MSFENEWASFWEQPAAGERVVKTFDLPGNTEFSVLVGWYGKEGDYPVSFRVYKGGRVFQGKNPLAILLSLVEHEVEQLRQK